MTCGCNKSGQLLKGGKYRRSRRTRGVSSRRRRRGRVQKRKSRVIRGGNLGDQVKGLFNMSSAIAPGVHPANNDYGRGNFYLV